jgi:Tol biopolymer transport system component
VCDLPGDLDELTVAGEQPLAGTATSRPAPARGVIQRRLTFTASRRYPGVDGPRHWLRSSPDGSRIACLLRDEAGVVQLFTVSPNGGPPVQVTHDAWSVASSFSWSADGRRLAYVADSSVFIVDVASGASTRLTDRLVAAPPRPEACVFSPDGRRIAFMRSVAGQSTPCGSPAVEVHNQIVVVDAPE